MSSENQECDLSPCTGYTTTNKTDYHDMQLRIPSKVTFAINLTLLLLLIILFCDKKKYVP
jgi:hypothetical protein